LAYATVADVAALAALRTFTASTRPNTTEVTGFLEDAQGVLDSILAARGYQLPVPITATNALDLLEHYTAVGAWAMVEAAAPTSDAREIAERAWMNAQKMLRDGLIEPVGLSQVTTTVTPRAGFAPTAMFCRDMAL
jgi:phage gp36-like protein